ncbi:uncharacterized protein N0V89_010079 [Didymosphaeria variabile]|uniref:Uncharacterized protein n=1 Tax=Didymosphaeria variabile TaxID=1932322 RepID=A0A9W9C7Y2_9PLEO|nr:uncharacterized protein N0V89_010079 [Didymosphaeria variabile]KAJ4348701.1 hypothetical protein N0V89_010079 [Didymosphaeria variabile]
MSSNNTASTPTKASKASAKAPSTPTKPSNITTTTPQLTPPARKAPSMDDLVEHLADTKVDHRKDEPMDDLAGAFGQKWSPNSTFKDMQEEQDRRIGRYEYGALTYRPKGKEEDASGRK